MVTTGLSAITYEGAKALVAKTLMNHAYDNYLDLSERDALASSIAIVNALAMAGALEDDLAMAVFRKQPTLLDRELDDDEDTYDDGSGIETEYDL